MDHRAQLIFQTSEEAFIWGTPLPSHLTLSLSLTESSASFISIAVSSEFFFLPPTHHLVCIYVCVHVTRPLVYVGQSDGLVAPWWI